MRIKTIGIILIIKYLKVQLQLKISPKSKEITVRNRITLKLLLVHSAAVIVCTCRQSLQDLDSLWLKINSSTNFAKYLSCNFQIKVEDDGVVVEAKGQIAIISSSHSSFALLPTRKADDWVYTCTVHLSIHILYKARMRWFVEEGTLGISSLWTYRYVNFKEHYQGL